MTIRTILDGSSYIFRTIVTVFLSCCPIISCTRYNISEDHIPTHSTSLEVYNRSMSRFNDFIYNIFLKPIVKIYSAVIPKFLRDRIDSFLKNILTPVNVTYSLLAGDINEAKKNFSAFTINTLFSLGLFQIVKHESMYKSFDDTLGSWGVEYGTYVVLPLLGSCTTRGIIGQLVDFFTNPVYLMTRNKKLFLHPNTVFNSYSAFVIIHRYLSVMDILEAFKKSNLNYYPMQKSLYLQNLIDYKLKEDDYIKDLFYEYSV